MTNLSRAGASPAQAARIAPKMPARTPQAQQAPAPAKMPPLAPNTGSRINLMA